MFLRRFERRKNGKPHSYWALVESFRTAKGSRQRVVAYLGELAPGEQDGWAQLGCNRPVNDRRPPVWEAELGPSARCRDLMALLLALRLLSAAFAATEPPALARLCRLGATEFQHALWM